MVAREAPSAMSVRSSKGAGRGQEAPYFSICIPQYNRTRHLIAACKTFAAQTFRDFEVCISDDCSTDGRADELISYLQSSGLTYRYVAAPRNLRYDANLRQAIGMSRGRYVWLMGNDDGLMSAEVLEQVHSDLERAGPVAVAITNYAEPSTGTEYRRMLKTGVLGDGPRTAVATFRRYSFVSGVILEGEAARHLATDEVDGTEMYQMFLGTSLVAGGGRFLAIDRFCVEKDLQVPGEVVDSYSRRERLRPCPIRERSLPMGQLLRVVVTGLKSHVPPGELQRLAVAVARQLYRYIYPFWVIEYRRIQSWNFALGVLIGFRPSVVAACVPLTAPRRAYLWSQYLLWGAAALAAPVAVFDALRRPLYAIAKRT